MSTTKNCCSGTDPTEECKALVAWYNATSGVDGYLLHGSWLMEGTFCDWYSSKCTFAREREKQFGAASSLCLFEIYGCSLNDR